MTQDTLFSAVKAALKGEPLPVEKLKALGAQELLNEATHFDYLQIVEVTPGAALIGSRWGTRVPKPAAITAAVGSELSNSDSNEGYLIAINRVIIVYNLSFDEPTLKAAYEHQTGVQDIKIVRL